MINRAVEEAFSDAQSGYGRRPWLNSIRNDHVKSIGGDGPCQEELDPVPDPNQLIAQTRDSDLRNRLRTL
jgi:hypothetical protein